MRVRVFQPAGRQAVQMARWASDREVGLPSRVEQLAIGDESNAAIDAIDAVSLMTVHAAKGLEFPIVFLVNLGSPAILLHNTSPSAGNWIGIRLVGRKSNCDGIGAQVEAVAALAGLRSE